MDRANSISIDEQANSRARQSLMAEAERKAAQKRQFQQDQQNDLNLKKMKKLMWGNDWRLILTHRVQHNFTCQISK